MVYDPGYQPQRHDAPHEYPQDYRPAQPPYPIAPAHPQGQYYRPAPGTNIWAILALVSVFTFAPLGIIAGHVALSQIKRTGEQGRAMAIVGLAFGYALTFVFVAAIVAIVVYDGFLAPSVDPYYADYSASATSSLAVPDEHGPLGLSGV